jgi:hypothetical protein
MIIGIDVRDLIFFAFRDACLPQPGKTVDRNWLNLNLTSSKINLPSLVTRNQITM